MLLGVKRFSHFSKLVFCVFVLMPPSLVILAASVAASANVSKDQALLNRISKEEASLDPTRRKILLLDRLVMLELIYLSRFNVHFHISANYHNPWRAWTYPLAQQLGTGTSFANTLTDIIARANGLNKAELVLRQAQKGGREAVVVGNAVNGTSSALELLQNGYSSLCARTRGYSPRQSVAHVQQALATIDDLLDKRAKLVGQSDDPEKLLALQGRILRHIRNQILYEFKVWSVQSREVEWRENVFYAIDAAQNYGAMTSGILSIQGFSKPEVRGASALVSLSSSVAATLNPIIRDACGRIVGAYQMRQLAKSLPQGRPRTVSQLQQDWQELNLALRGDMPASIDKREIDEVAFLAVQSKEFDSVLKDDEGRMERLRRVAHQQALAGPLIGLTNVARTTCQTVAFYGYNDRPLVSNRINFAGRISQATGQSYALYATPKAAIQNWVYQRRLKREGKLPSQIFARRLNDLDCLEAAIKANE
jgi:hypothetical protein